jgi:hypothetical protein
MGMDELIYQRPADYELEREGDSDDVEFFVALTRRLKPKPVLSSLAVVAESLNPWRS